MKEEDVRRLAGLAGGGVFVMSLLLLLLKASPFNALIWALAAGLALGGAVYAVGLVAVMGRAASPAPAPAPEPEQAQSKPDETRLFSAKDVADGLAPDQTVRIEPGTLDYILPEISPEQVLKEREGLDIGALEEGIEASRKARETSTTGGEQGGI